MEIRRQITTEDRPVLEEILRATGFFNSEELSVALELVDDRLSHGERSHYRFIVAEHDGQAIGYACWGVIPGTVASADVYWLAVQPGWQGKGVGRALLASCERWIAEEGRRRIYLETATRAQYKPTRTFYLACGYELVAELPEYYASGDGKAIFLKVLAPAAKM